MWMKNGEGLFNTESGLLIYVKKIMNSHNYQIVFANVNNNTPFQVCKGTHEQCRAMLSNIEVKLNPVNVGILHNGETESVERELRNILGEDM